MYLVSERVENNSSAIATDPSFAWLLPSPLDFALPWTSCLDDGPKGYAFEEDKLHNEGTGGQRIARPFKI